MTEVFGVGRRHSGTIVLSAAMGGTSDPAPARRPDLAAFAARDDCVVAPGQGLHKGLQAFPVVEWRTSVRQGGRVIAADVFVAELR